MTTRASVVDGARNATGARVPAGQPPNAFVDERPQLGLGQRAGDHERGIARHEVLLPERRRGRRESWP